MTHRDQWDKLFADPRFIEIDDRVKTLLDELQTLTDEANRMKDEYPLLKGEYSVAPHAGHRLRLWSIPKSSEED